MAIAELPRPTVNEAAFIRQAKHICADLMAHKPAIYWIDFLASVTVAWTALIVCLSSEMPIAIRVVGFVVAGFLLYRSSVFTHELAHLPPTRFRVFRVVWNLLFGCPFLMPTFLYTDHRVHHTSQTYGTGKDNEYYPYGRSSLNALLIGMLLIFIVPILVLIRFGILSPLSLLHPTIRKVVWERASSLGSLSASYRREPPTPDERRNAIWQQVLCFAVVATLVTSLAMGWLSWTSIGLIVAVYVFAMIVNNFRVYAAHRYLSTGEPMTFLEQMLDSTTIPALSGVLWAPLGMRYHAVHHLFPAMPYHEMGKAHRRLMKQLPPDSPYHQTLMPSMWASIRKLVQVVRVNSARDLAHVEK